MKPILLLDVDGVLNILPGVTKRKVAPPEGFREERVLLNDHDRVVLVHKHIGSRLAALVDEVEIIWFTSWGKYANTAIAPLFGLPSHLNWWPARETEHKEVSLMRFVRNYHLNLWRSDHPQRHVLAVDDVLGASSVEAVAPWGNVLDFSTLQTDPTVGLRHSDVDLIIDWARS